MKLSGLVGLALVAGAAVAGYAYYKQYRKFHEDLEDDFKEFEDDIDEEKVDVYTDPNKKYTSLNANKEEFVDAAKATFETAKGMVPPAKKMAKDIADIVTEKSSDAGIIANDYVYSIKERVNTFVDKAKDKVSVVEEDVLNGNGMSETTDDVIIDIDASGNVTRE